MKDYYGYVYLVRNLQNGKIYIGQSSKFEYVNSYYGSGILIQKAIKRYGKQFFEKIILGYCKTKEEAHIAEIECISFFDSTNTTYGYNLNRGGLGGKHGEASKKKMSEVRKGIKFSDQHLKNLSLSHIGQKAWNKGVSQSEETREKNRQSHLGKKSNKKGKTYEDLYGKEKAKEIKRKMSLKKLGKTYEEIYGEEGAKLKKLKMSKSLRRS